VELEGEEGAARFLEPRPHLQHLLKALPGLLEGEARPHGELGRHLGKGLGLPSRIAPSLLLQAQGVLHKAGEGVGAEGLEVPGHRGPHPGAELLI